MNRNFIINQFKPCVKTKVTNEIKRVLKVGILVNGRYTEKLTKELEKKFQGKYALIVDSGTSALVLALKLLNSENKMVLIPSYVCSALLAACLQVGAKPILYDIEWPYTYFDIKQIKKSAPKNLSAIIVPHLFGRAVNIEEFVNEFGKDIVIEDCATSFGVVRKNTLCGRWSNFAVFSFGPTKYISSIKGGALLVKNKNNLKNACDIYWYDKKTTLKLRYNFLSNEISNLLSLYQIKDFKYIIKKRMKLYYYYVSNLNRKFEFLTNSDKENNFYKFIILSKKKNIIKEKFYKNKIEVSEPVFLPIHRILKLDKKNYAGSEEFYRTALSLPLYPYMTKRHQDKVINVLIQ